MKYPQFPRDGGGTLNCPSHRLLLPYGRPHISHIQRWPVIFLQNNRHTPVLCLPNFVNLPIYSRRERRSYPCSVFPANFSLLHLCWPGNILKIPPHLTHTFLWHPFEKHLYF